MPNFNYLKKYEVKSDKTFEYEIDELDSNPTLIMVPATSENKLYYNQILKKQAKNPMKALKNMNRATVKKNRDHDRKLFPLYVIKGWKGVIDTDKKPVEFNMDNCFEFLLALPDWIFDKIRNYAASPENFIEDEVIEDLSKNSASSSSGISDTKEMDSPLKLQEQKEENSQDGMLKNPSSWE